MSYVLPDSRMILKYFQKLVLILNESLNTYKTVPSIFFSMPKKILNIIKIRLD